MPDCTYHDICGLSATYIYPETHQSLCVLHSPDKDKPGFAETLDAHRKDKGDNFQSMVFPEGADFSDATFTKRADFSRAAFTKRANFIYSKFTKGADFGGARFTKGGNFSGARFTEGANFIYSKFTKGADFSDAWFTKETYFRDARFTKDAVFIGAMFTEDADFSGARFTEGAYFIRARFTKEANFIYSKFTKGAHFSGARFTEGAHFSGATFLSETVFYTARFSPEARLSFRRSRFQGRMIITAGQETSREETLDEKRMIPVFTSAQQVDFRNVVIEEPDTLTFIGADFTRCQFLGTDLRKVQLVGVSWPQQDNRVVVYDEIIPLEAGETRQWDQIERLYRQLKQNYEDQRDYERAGDFHYGEKQMRRDNPATPFGRRVLLWLYWLVSGYGERIGRPLLCTGVLFVMATCGYLWWGLKPQSQPWHTLQGIEHWLTAANYSFQVLTFLRPTDLAPQGIAKLVHIIQSLLGPLFIGLFALAVRQRLKR